MVPAREGLRQVKRVQISLCDRIGEVVPAREGLRQGLLISNILTESIGEVVPAREGLRQNESPRRGLCLQSEKWFQQEKD